MDRHETKFLETVQQVVAAPSTDTGPYSSRSVSITQLQLTMIGENPVFADISTGSEPQSTHNSIRFPTSHIVWQPTVIVWNVKGYTSSGQHLCWCWCQAVLGSQDTNHHIPHETSYLTVRLCVWGRGYMGSRMLVIDIDKSDYDLCSLCLGKSNDKHSIPVHLSLLSS